MGTTECEKMNLPTTTLHKMLIYLTLVILQVKLSTCWFTEMKANSLLNFDEMQNTHVYKGETDFSDKFKIIGTEGEWLFLGARNRFYNISMATLEENVLERIEWESSTGDVKYCKGLNGKANERNEQCENYIRVYGKKSNDEILVCGTNSYKPKCRTYAKSQGLTYSQVGKEDQDGVGFCPFDSEHNSTFIFNDGKFISATVADLAGRDPLIVSKQGSSILRSEQHDSKWLNEPQFVSSFDIGEFVYFFYREEAVEYINCGKAVFSRVGRICKKDRGGTYLLVNTLTSFFKSRLNCSIPGKFPYYFNEIQSTSDYGQGNFMSTHDSANRTKMFYAVFRTPENSFPSSAVCAFKLSDIERAFEGKFKGQHDPQSNWLPVSNQQTPNPHPAASCPNNSQQIHDTTLNFIKTHRLMDESVPAAGGMPVFVLPSYRGKMTKVAVDWQVHASDNRYYDVIFVGTEDGRVLKAINKGRGYEVETVVIEEIQVFNNKAPVTDLKIYRDKGLEKLIVLSKEDVASIPLHRCKEQKTCRACVRIQDPYCSWSDDECAASDRGIQNIVQGRHEACGSDETTTKVRPTTLPPVDATTPSARCNCSCKTTTNKDQPDLRTTKSPGKQITEANIENPDDTTQKPQFDVEPASRNDRNKKSGPMLDAQREGGKSESSLSTAEFAIAVVCSIVLSSIISFIAGYKVRSCRHQEEPNNMQQYKEEYYGSLTKNHNKYRDNEPRYINHSQLEHNNSQKQLNLLVNLPKGSNLPNGSAPQKPVLNIPLPDKTYV